MNEERIPANSNDDDVIVEAQGNVVSPVPSVGQQLRASREARGLSVDDVSSALKLSPRQVEALESDDWSCLPKTIVRGFVRNYARFLNRESISLMAALDSLPMQEAPELEVQVGLPVKMPEEGRADRRDYVRVFSGLVVLLLAVLAYFLAPQGMWQSSFAILNEFVQTKMTAPETENVPAREPENKSGDASTAVPVPVATTVLPEASPSPVPPPRPQTQSSEPAVPGPAVSAPPSPASPSSSGSSLKFSFDQPSWVEVRDRNGQIVFSQLNQAGSLREVDGQPPFSLVIGNAAHVTLQYKGKTVDLSQRSKENVARLTLE